MPRFDEAIYRFFLERRRARFTSNPAIISGCFVVSVGNISSGGTGKTPAVQLLARGLQQRGKNVAVVCRGHGGSLSKAGALVSDGETLFCDARQAGDEAVLHARALPGIGVVIGCNRIEACRRAVEKLNCDAIVLDDALQFWSLARDFDLVLLDARQPFGNGHLLPRGRLREPMDELKRADACLLTRCDLASPDCLERNRVLVAQHTTAPIFLSNHVAHTLRDEANAQIFPLEVLRDAKIGALSAIADNDGFLQSLEKSGARIVASQSAFDHHHWRESEVRRFAKAAQRKGAQFLVTTEKDAVKIDANWCAPLSLRSVRIALQMDEEDKLWAQIEARLAAKNVAP